MGMFHRVKVGEKIINSIDWEMNPDMSFGTFESWGGRERVRSNDERIYYFFVDNWGDRPKLCLMERGIKHANIIAEIKAPLDIVEKCVKSQGSSSIFEKSYAINDQVKEWLIDNVLDDGNADLVIPRTIRAEREDMGPELVHVTQSGFDGEIIRLPSELIYVNDEEIGDVVKKLNFFDAEHNPAGSFSNVFAATDHPDVIVDQRTGLMWQRGGVDIGSLRLVQKQIDALNSEKYAGFSDWRLPSLEETLSLLDPVKNSKGVYLQPCFSKDQPFVFVNARRRPGGQWFVDFKQGRAFWSSATIPGGFGRLVRAL